MKRSQNSLENETSRTRAVRRKHGGPGPSCQLCRKQKLRCDRDSPCSNCKSRMMVCTFKNDKSPKQSTFLTLEQLRGAQESIATRLERLKALVASGHSHGAQDALTKQKWPSPPLDRDHESQGIEVSETLSVVESGLYRLLLSDIQLEPGTPDSAINNDLAHSLLSIMAPCKTKLNRNDILSALPPWSYASALSDHYTQQVGWIFPVVHSPTLKTHIKAIYTSLEDGQMPDLGRLAIVTTVFAISAYYFSPSSKLPFDAHEARTYTSRWLKLAQSALWAANFIVMPTIETIQSVILISHHLLPSIGAIEIFRVLLSTVLQSCRALKIHLIDSSSNNKKRSNEPGIVNYVDLEIKRRIWWHVASTDWLLSFIGGYRTGYYSIHPSQMYVNKPSNVDDSDIGSHPDYARPMSVPTDMTYSHSWYAIAELSRQVTDATTEAACDTNDMPYDILLELDSKFAAHLNSMPNFLRLDSMDQEATRHLYEQRPILAYHRDMAHILVHTMLHRLHRPYLVRGSRHPRYSYSRTVCLRSARHIIELSKKLTAYWGPNPMKLWTITHHNLVATLVLVIDYCLNRNDPRAAERKEEILDCFRHLEDCQEHSAVAKRGLRQLKEVLAHGLVPKRFHENAETSSPRDNAEVSRYGIAQAETDLLWSAEEATVADPVHPLIPVPVHPDEPISTTIMQIDRHADTDSFFESIDFENMSFDVTDNVTDEDFSAFFEAIEGRDDSLTM